MQAGGPLDPLPLWLVFLVTVAVILLSIEGGFRLGTYRRSRSEGEDRPPVGEMVAATLALLAFILAFTFGLAGSWFDVRRRLVIDEANAIGTTYLRTGMLPEPHRSDVRSLLREYVNVRLEAIKPGKLGQSISRSEELHARLWAHATAVGEQHADSVVVGLFIWSLNEVIDLHTTRLALAARTRLPGSIWATLYCVAILGMSVIGYHAGLAGSGRSLAILALVLAFSAVMTLIADIDRPQEGLLRVSPQPLLDLQKNLSAPRGESAFVPSVIAPNSRGQASSDLSHLRHEALQERASLPLPVVDEPVNVGGLPRELADIVQGGLKLGGHADEPDGDGLPSRKADPLKGLEGNGLLHQQHVAELDELQALHQGHVAFHLITAVKDPRVGLGNRFHRDRVDLNHPDFVRDVFTTRRTAAG